MNHLGLFAKYWQPGKVKTRLAAQMGHSKAGQVYRAFLNHMLARLGECGDVRTIAYSPPEKKNEFVRLTSNANWGLVSQRGDDLGERMSNFFLWALDGAIAGRATRTRVVLIGSDTPQLSPARIEQAFAALDKAEIVLGPSSDGGYYLIGMANKYWPVFEDVNWSTSLVLKQTLGRLEQLRVDCELLPEMTDIDEPDDLEHLTKFLESNPSERNAQLLDAINAIDQQAKTNE